MTLIKTCSLFTFPNQNLFPRARVRFFLDGPIRIKRDVMLCCWKKEKKTVFLKGKKFFLKKNRSKKKKIKIPKIEMRF